MAIDRRKRKALEAAGVPGWLLDAAERDNERAGDLALAAGTETKDLADSIVAEVYRRLAADLAGERRAERKDWPAGPRPYTLGDAVVGGGDAARGQRQRAADAARVNAQRQRLFNPPPGPGVPGAFGDKDPIPGHLRALVDDIEAGRFPRPRRVQENRAYDWSGTDERPPWQYGRRQGD